jgi:hypothetical protein
MIFTISSRHRVVKGKKKLFIALFLFDDYTGGHGRLGGIIFFLFH